MAEVRYFTDTNGDKYLEYDPRYHRHTYTTKQEVYHEMFGVMRIITIEKKGKSFLLVVQSKQGIKKLITDLK